MKKTVQRMIGVRPGEERLVRLSSLLAFFALAMSLLVLATVTALFLGQRPRADLPLAYAGAAVFGVLSALALSEISGRIARVHEAALVFISLALALLVSWAGLPFVSSHYLFIVYPVCTALSSLAVVQAFAVISDCVDAEQAKRLLPVIGSGGTLGAVCAGGLLAIVAPLLGTRTLLLAAGVAALVSVWLAVLLVRSHVSEQPRSLRPPRASKAPRTNVNLLAYLRAALLSDRLTLLFAASQLAVVVASTLLKFEFESALQTRLEMDKIAVFLGLFNLSANLSVLLMQTFLERPILRRFGMSMGLVSVPALFAFAMPVLWLLPSLTTIVMARFGEHLLRFSIARTADDLVLLPLSSVKRRRAKTLIAGALLPTAILLTSGLIFATSAVSSNVRTSIAWCCGIVGVWLAFGLRKPYLARLEGELYRPRLTLDSIGAPPILASRAGIEAALEQTLREADPRRVSFALCTLAETKITIDPKHLQALYRNPDPRLREATYVAAAATGNAHWVDELLTALEQEGDEAARIACARALCTHLPEDRLAELDTLLEDPLPGVRAEALARRNTLTSLRGDDLEVRSAALRAAGRAQKSEHLPLIVAALAERTLASAALKALRAWPAEEAARALIPATDPAGARTLQKRAVRALGQLRHVAASERLHVLLSSDSEDIQTAALRALIRQRRASALSLSMTLAMQRGARAELRQIRIVQLARARLTQEPETFRTRAAQAELVAWSERCQARLFLWFALVHPPDEMRRTALSLGNDDRRARAFALEVLGQRLDASLNTEVAALLNPVPGSDETPNLERVLGVGREANAASVLCLCQRSVARSVAYYLSPHSHALKLGAPPMSVLETMFVLRTVELFSRLSSEELRAVAELSVTKHLKASEILFREGEIGDAFYVIKKGEAEVSKNGKVLATLRTGDWFGELALLDQGVRTATVTARDDTELTCVAAADFHELIEEVPSIARAMLGVLAKRQSSLLTSQHS